MSSHEKEGTRRCLHQDGKSFITPSLHLCVFKTTTYIFMQAIGCQDVVLFTLPNANKQTNNMSKQNKNMELELWTQ